MNIAREAAHRLDPVLWVREVLGMTPTAWQEAFLRPTRSIHSGTDPATGLQNHPGGLGNGPRRTVYAGIPLRRRLPNTTAKRRSRPQSTRHALKMRREADQ